MGINLYDLHLAAAQWEVLPAGFDTDELGYLSWDEPRLTEHGVFLASGDPAVVLVGTRTALQGWLLRVLEQVRQLPPDMRHADGSLTARTVDPAWAGQDGVCGWCGNELQDHQPTVSGPAGLAHLWCNDELTPEQALRRSAANPAA